MKQPSTLAPTFNKAGSVPTVFLSPDDDPNELKVEKRIVLVAHWQHVFYSIYVGIVLRVLKRIKLIVLLSFFS